MVDMRSFNADDTGSLEIHSLRNILEDLVWVKEDLVYKKVSSFYLLAQGATGRLLGQAKLNGWGDPIANF